MRTVQAVRERQQKMASTELGDRDVFGVKLGAKGAVVQVFLCRGGRVIERVEFVWDAARERRDRGRRDRSGDPAVLCRPEPPPEIHVPVAPPSSSCSKPGWRRRPSRKVRIVVPQRGDKKGMMELAHRNAALAYRTRFDANATANYDALESLQAALRLPKLPRRIDCFDISTIQGSDTVASMVVCEDGRMKPGRISKIQRSSEIRELRTGAGSPQARRALRLPAPGSRQIPRRFRGHGAGGAPALFASVLENGGPFPDLIVIDGGKGQLNAAYAALETVGLSNLVAVGLAKKEELVFTRDSIGAAGARLRTARHCDCCSGSATRPIALRSRSTASRDRKRDPAVGAR